MQLAQAQTCPLCLSMRLETLFSLAQRNYIECQECDLLFTHPACLLGADGEKERYAQHNNGGGDGGYRSHLERLIIPLGQKLKCGMRGLDYGCGPQGVLHKMLEESGYRMTSYDPFFGPPLSELFSPYDFITCTEVAEHFAAPLVEFTKIVGLVKSGGWIGVLTMFREAERRSHSWWYLRDATHRCFYSKRTFELLCTTLKCVLVHCDQDVALMQKK
jgi:hypothetical protein